MTTPAQLSPLHHPAPREASKRLSRSPKRVRSTPPIPDHTHSPSPTYSSGSTRRSVTARPSIAGKRGTSYDKDTRHPKTSPWQSRDAISDWGLSRRREMSVPLLSQTLSTFTLSQSSSAFGLFPTETDGCEITPPAFNSAFTLPSEVTPSAAPTSHTPRRTPGHNLRSSFFGDLPTDHPHPSTAPLPQLPTFLGSPFSSKTARGGYRFKSMSPSKGVMTERIGQEGFENLNLDWLGKTEWMCDEETPRDITEEQEGSGPAATSSKLRRDHSSTSSIDDFCDSGTSSSSLTSLGRSSGEQARPHLVSIWGEAEIHHLEDEEEDLATPSRQLFQHSTGSAGILQMAVKDKASPSMSPLVGKSRSRQRSPLQVFFMQTPGAAHTPLPENPSPTLPPSTSKSVKSFNSLLPRLVSSRKPGSTACAGSPQSSQSAVTQPSSGPSSAPPSRLPMSRSQKSLFRAPAPSALSEIRPARPTGWSPSARLGDDSEPESSPSKAPDALRDSVSSSTTDSTNGSTSTTDSPIEPARAAMVARRKTLASQPSAKSKSTGTVKPIRPSLRRGVTDPKGESNASVFSPEKTFSTPVSALFGDEKPSPAAFASTGLVKKKSGTPGLEIPRFGDSEPATRIAGLPRGGQPVKSRLGIMIASSPAHRHALANVSTYEDSPVASSGGTGVSAPKTDGSSSTDASVSVYVRGVQQTRGLRRKTSSMFGPSTSSGSIGDGSAAANSPATPTKGMFSVPGLGITTPSPVAGQQNVYPFASSTAQAPSSAASRRSTVEVVSPIEAAPAASLASRLNRTIKRPVARASNPMLAETFKLDGRTGHTKTPSIGTPSEALKVGGSRLDQDFTLVCSLGKGEFSQVWKVMEKTTGTMYAVKAGRPYTGYKNRLRQLEEVSILRQLSLTPHDHVLNFIDSWEHSNRLFIRTELAACGDFATFLLSIADQGAMDESRLWKTLFELSSGLQHIHENSFVHLDLKPSNILITQAGALKIADFGMSLLISSDGEVGGLSPALPKSGNDGGFLWGQSEGTVPVPSPILDREVEGDREYLCPEALSEKTVGTAADMFSLGILLLESALNVVLPSNGDGWVKLRNDDFSDTLEHYLPRGPRRSPGSTQPDLPIISEQFIELVKGLMCSRPMERWTLGDVLGVGPVRRMAELANAARDQGLSHGRAEGYEGESSGRSMGPALVEDGGWFLRYVLGEASE